MKHRSSPFLFNDHREFLRHALKEQRFSYRSFAAKNSEVVSFNSLAMALSKGKSGTKSKPMRNFSPEMLARIGKALKLTDEEITYLVLLLWDTNSEVLDGPYGAAYSDCIKRLVRDYKSRQIQSTNKQAMAKTRFSETGETVARLLDLLPPQSKLRLTKEILSESKIALARQRNKAGVKAITSVIGKLEELSAIGAP